MSAGAEKPVLHRAFGFGLVGIVGFAVDAGVLLLLKPALGPFGGRAISFLCAVSTTFTLNRLFVFEGGRHRPIAAQAGLFLAANSIGMLINNAVYALLVLAHVGSILAVAAGSLAGGAANFLASDRFVFTPKSRD